MKILQVTSPRDFVIRRMDVPRPGPGEVLLRVTAVATCPQWDLHLRHNEPMFVGHRFQYPYTPGQPGHEATGVIEAVGEGVTDLKPGDRVSAWRDAGHDVLGNYAQFAVHRAGNVLRVPDGLPDQAVAPLELAMCMGTVFRMLKEMRAIAGRQFGVTGLGPAGLVAVQMARAEGAEAVFGFDFHPGRRALACRLGAAACFDPRDDLSEEFPSLPGRPRLEAGVDCVGAKASVEWLMDRTEDAVALFGVQREDYAFRPRNFQVRLCGYKGHFRESAEYALALICGGQLDLAALVTHAMPLERYGEAIDLLEAQQVVKVCFLPWEA